MLTVKYPNEALSELLLPMQHYKPFPTIEQREQWEAFSEDVSEYWRDKGERHLDFTWPTLPAARFMDFVRNGNRKKYEEVDDQRRYALTYLAVAECVENKGRYLDQIINCIWLLCEQSTWALPAHMYLSKLSANAPLPDVAEQVIDLCAGEVAVLLAGTYYLLYPYGSTTPGSRVIGRLSITRKKKSIG